MESTLTKALVAEFVGTFALIFIGAGAGALTATEGGGGGLLGVALAHGLVVLGFAYAYGHLSGTHINPAVTLGLWVAGAIESVRAVAYIVVQIAGGVAGGFCLAFLLKGTTESLGETTLAVGVSPTQGLILEVILTFFLVNAVLHTAVSGKAGNLAGLAIGLTLVFCILMGGPLTGASLNPARTLGPGLVSGNLPDLWVYLVGPPLGGVLAAVLYRAVLGGKK